MVFCVLVLRGPANLLRIERLATGGGTRSSRFELTKDEMMVPQALGPTHERGYYVIWDTTHWRKERVSATLTSGKFIVRTMLIRCIARVYAALQRP